MLRNLPQVTKNLLLINILIYIVSIVVSTNGIDVNELAGAHYFNSIFFKPFQVVTHMFMHSLSDPLHLVFNMFILIMFGAHLERIWGAKRYFIFYISCGIGALVLYNSIGVYHLYEAKQQLNAIGVDYHVIDNMMKDGSFDNNAILNKAVNKFVYAGTLPENTHQDWSIILNYASLNMSTMVGASGALFGLLGGFAMLFPNTELMLIFPPIPIKAKYLIGGYLAYEIYNSIYASADTIAHLAHVGGAVVGIIFILVWRKTDRTNFY